MLSDKLKLRDFSRKYKKGFVLDNSNINLDAFQPIINKELCSLNKEEYEVHLYHHGICHPLKILNTHKNVVYSLKYLYGVSNVFIHEVDSDHNLRLDCKDIIYSYVDMYEFDMRAFCEKYCVFEEYDKTKDLDYTALRVKCGFPPYLIPELFTDEEANKIWDSGLSEFDEIYYHYLPVYLWNCSKKFSIEFKKTKLLKCPRCRKYLTEKNNFTELCERCYYIEELNIQHPLENTRVV